MVPSRVLRLALVVVVMLALPVGLAKAAPRMPIGFYDDTSFRWVDAKTIMANLKAASGANASMVHLLADWSQIAAEKPKNPLDGGDPAYRLSDLDAIVRIAPRYNLQVFITISGTPKWANGGQTPNHPPTRLSDLTDFAHMLAARYNGRRPGFGAVTRWAIWNEPNLALFLTPQFAADGTTNGMMGGAGMMGGTTVAAMSSGMTVQQMLDEHRKGVQAFPAKTQGTGNEILEPIVENGWKVFRLTATNVKWETKPGVFVDAMAYNGQIPGPELHVTYGDKVRIVVTNEMDQPTIMHFHGLTVPNAMDGVPYITQDPIVPGSFFTYEFTVQDPPGMYVYHSHFNSTEQVGKGLYGAIIVEPRSGQWPYRTVSWNPDGVLSFGAPAPIASEFTMFLGDGPLGYVLNAKEFPATTPIVANLGDWVLIHIANDGSMLHPMHLHGFHFEVVGEDGFPLASPYMADTLVVAPGQRFDVLVHADQPGAWAFHCHILPHVEGPQGMYGMVTALVVQ